MALPTKTDLVKMDVPYLGQPFVYVPAKQVIETKTMDYSYLGLPFTVNPNSIVVSSNFLAFMPF